MVRRRNDGNPYAIFAILNIPLCVGLSSFLGVDIVSPTFSRYGFLITVASIIFGFFFCYKFSNSISSNPNYTPIVSMGSIILMFIIWANMFFYTSNVCWDKHDAIVNDVVIKGGRKWTTTSSSGSGKYRSSRRVTNYHGAVDYYWKDNSVRSIPVSYNSADNYRYGMYARVSSKPGFWGHEYIIRNSFSLNNEKNMEFERINAEREERRKAKANNGRFTSSNSSTTRNRFNYNRRF